jgi:hypothetical protein
MFVWRKRAGTGWLAANEVALHEIAGRQLAIVSKPGHRNTIAEVASPNCSELEKIRRRFGGIIEKLPRNWLRKFLRGQKPKPLKIGKRLVIVSSTASKRMKRTLVIPAAAAFGTGEHMTTAMSLRMLESLTRKSLVRGAQPRHARTHARQGIFAARSGNGVGNSGIGSGTLRSEADNCDRSRSDRNRDGERKRAAKQDRTGRVPSSGCPAMEISSEDRHHYSKSLQRIADRDLAKTEMCGVVDSVRCFVGTTAPVGLRAKDKSNRRGGDATSREMARDLGEANHGVIPSASEEPRKHPLITQSRLRDVHRGCGILHRLRGSG